MAGLVSTLLGDLGLGSSGAASTSAMQACQAIANTQVQCETMGSAYSTAKNHYWSMANADDTPACVAFPRSAEDVSTAVEILQNYTDVDFAMKSGGHNPNRGFSSVDGGVLISFSNLADTTYNADTQTADVGPGSRWTEACTALEPYGVTVVGGRIGDVGVAGLLLGGGLSFLSGQYGLPADSVVNYEIVLSNATIVNANATSNPDLFWALKGGGNQFGIVSKFTMKTFKIGQIFGGTREYLSSSSSALLSATHEFILNFDPKAAVIVTSEITIDTLVEFFVVFFFYDGPEPLNGVFDKFDAIDSILDSTKTQSYSNLMKANSVFSPYGFRYLIRGTTLPNLPAPQGTDLYDFHYRSWQKYVTGGGPLEELLDLDVPGLEKGVLESAHIFSIAFQPMPHGIPAASKKINPAGNVLGLDSQFGDHVWMEYDISWLSAAADNDAHATAMSITSSINKYAKKKYQGVKNTNYQAGDVMDEEYNPTFLNDAMADQQPLLSYGQNTYQKLQGIQKKYDPSGFFPGRTGGFKFN